MTGIKNRNRGKATEKAIAELIGVTVEELLRAAQNREY